MSSEAQSNERPCVHSDRWSINTALVVGSIIIAGFFGVLYHIWHQGL